MNTLARGPPRVHLILNLQSKQAPRDEHSGIFGEKWPVPLGTADNSPARECWESRCLDDPVPQGRQTRAINHACGRGLSSLAGLPLLPTNKSQHSRAGLLSVVPM